MKRTACVIALAAGTGMAMMAAPGLADPAPATVASGLQVNIVPPGTVSNDSTIPLDVKFRGGNIRIVELFIDGTRITRQALSTRDGHGILHFTLDPTLLTEGSHEIMVKAIEADGSSATSTTHMTVSTGDLNALARFTSPKRNAEVQGIVPIQIKISDSIRNPYVTFLVDKDFLALRNYAPFTYNWDSAKVTNGLHTLNVQVIDGDTSEVIQNITVEVNVKNIGGFTKIEQPVTVAKGTPGGSVSGELNSIAKSAMSLPNVDAQDVKLLRSGGTFNPSLRLGGAPDRTLMGITGAVKSHDGGMPGLRNGTRASLPETLKNASANPLSAWLPAPSNPKADKPSLLSDLLNPMKVSLRKDASAFAGPSINPPLNPSASRHIAPGLAGLVGNPNDLVSLQTSQRLAYQPLKIRRQGGLALRPSMEMGSVRTIGAPTAPRAGRPAPLRVNSNSPLKTFDVAFNSSMIHFDVAPRIEKGLPLAPFRAIFEHNGGTVQWFNQSKVVRATDNSHEIEIHVGSKEAKVNNKSLMMEAIPYLERGRTIVPLSFIRDAMDVKVTFDPETGHLLIESNK